VHNHLQSLGVQHELVTLSNHIKGTERLAELLDLEPCSVVKTLVFIADGQPVLTMVPGDKRADKGKLKEHLSAARLLLATEHEVFEITDFMVTALPPVAFKSSVTTIADHSLTGNNIVYAAGGDPNIVLKLRASDLVKATKAALADICVAAR
jgi:prolyl-tRNA editing enzyme YbaK/EbsC (Cys-tRNA(Pro) deacylase)